MTLVTYPRRSVLRAPPATDSVTLKASGRFAGGYDADMTAWWYAYKYGHLIPFVVFNGIYIYQSVGVRRTSGWLFRGYYTIRVILEGFRGYFIVYMVLWYYGTIYV